MNETTEQKIARIKIELLEIHKNTNEGPRLIAEMMKDLPNPRGPLYSASGKAMSHNLG
jgi:hypothetical protein